MYGESLMRLRYDGPIVIDSPNSPEMWTVIDASSPFYRFTNGAASLIDMGFTVEELNAAKQGR
jgi:hypothetical protein